MKNIFYILAIPVLLLFNSCKEETTSTPPPVVEDMVLLGTQEATTLGYTIELYANMDLYSGYNYIEARVYESGTKTVVTNADVMFMPMMTMGSGMKHSCPVEQPMFMDGAYMGTVTFVMPSTAGTWSLNIEVTPNGGATPEELMFPVTVVAADEAKIYSFSSGGMNYFVAYIDPMTPDVGINDYEIVVYKRESMMDWPPVANLDIEIEPLMPSMGHGSPNNEDPTYLDNGHYKGKVNFTMTGYWEINQKIMDNTGATMDDAGMFPITL